MPFHGEMKWNLSNPFTSGSGGVGWVGEGRQVRSNAQVIIAELNGPFRQCGRRTEA